MTSAMRQLVRISAAAIVLTGFMSWQAPAYAQRIPEASEPACGYCGARILRGQAHSRSCPQYREDPGPSRGSTSSGSARSTTTYSAPSTPRPHKTTNEEIVLKAFQQTIDQMFKPDPAVLQRIRQTRMEGDQAHESAVMSQQAAEDERRSRAQLDAEAARERQLQDLAGALQGMPGSSTAPAVDLRPGGTPFFGSGGSGGARTDPGLEGIRAGASSGFDTRGGFAGTPPPPPPPVSSPAAVAPVDRPIPPEKATPEILARVKERDELRAKKKALADELETYESKVTLTPEESKAMEHLRKDLAQTLNKETYLTFTIDRSLDDPSPPARAGGTP